MERIEITCADGVMLQGHFIIANPEQQTPDHTPVLISPATGVKQTFYLRFEFTGVTCHDSVFLRPRFYGTSVQNDRIFTVTEGRALKTDRAKQNRRPSLLTTQTTLNASRLEQRQSHRPRDDRSAKSRRRYGIRDDLTNLPSRDDPAILAPTVHHQQ